MTRILTHMLQATTEKYPNRVAYKNSKEHLTYEQLVCQSNQLANVLIQSGIKPGDRVGIYLDRCLETAVAVYGILTAGAAFVPLDPAAPANRTQFLLEDCAIQHLITRQILASKLKNALPPNHRMRLVVGFDPAESPAYMTWAQLREADSTAPVIQVKEHDLAYIMYTSGSTGLPKGIMHTHYSGYSYAKLAADLYKIREQDIIGGHAPLHFDISTMAYLTVPLVGASAVIISDAHTKLPASLAQLVHEEKLTVWYSVPLALIQMLNYGLLEEKEMLNLRLVLYGGEPFPTKYLRELMLRWPQAKFCNVYGPAEVNQCTYYFIPEPPVENKPVPIGKVWPETEMMVIDAYDQEVLPGEQGELLINSTTMMKGYWNNPDLTEKSLLATGEAGLSFYRTGDLVVQDEKGNLHFHGRKDRQIKTRGYRVELEMIETLLKSLDEIKEAIVFTKTDEPMGTVIEAAFIPEETSSDISSLVKGKLAEKLPKYAIPTRLYQVTHLPRTTTGKIDHQMFRKQIGISSKI